MSVHLRIALADDEAIARKRMVRLLSEIPDVSVVLVSESGDALLSDLEAIEADVLLLDIQMPGISGLETRTRLGHDAPYVVYVTAHPDHAIEAFDVGAVDYVLKPVDAVRLTRAIERVRGLLSRASAPIAAADRVARIPIETRTGILLVAAHEISHASFDGELVTLHLNDRQIITERTLADLEDVLTRYGFERVHRRYLLNLNRVLQLEDQTTGGYIAHCDNGAAVTVSRQVARQLRRRLLGR